MSRVNIGTSTNSIATGYANQRKIVKTSGGELVLFAYSGTQIVYQISSDNGVTWNGTFLVAVNIAATIFDVYIESNDDIYLVYKDPSAGKPYFIFGTYSAGSWSWGTAVSIANDNVTNGLTLTKRSNGDLWASGFSGSTLYTYYSTNTGSTWTRLTISNTFTVNQCQIVPVGTNIWLIVQSFISAGQGLKYFIYTSSWSAATTIADNVATAAATSLGVGVISSSAIYVTTRTTSGIKVYYYNGSSWDAGTLLSSNPADESPSIQNVNGNPLIAWADDTSSQWDISYRHWNGSSWDAQVDLTNDAAQDKYPSTILYDSGYLYICYTTGTSNPYTIYFDKAAFITTITKTIDSDSKIFVSGTQQTIDAAAAIVGQINQDIYSDAEISPHIQNPIYSDAKVFVSANLHILDSNALIKVPATQQTITSYANITGHVQQLLSSLAYIASPVFEDISNKITFSLSALKNISNKFNMVLRTLNDVSNFVNFCKGSLYNIANDFRTKKLTLPDINNDFRFIFSFQKAADQSIQSLGKAYIKVYINNVEQTDTDVDSIRISKQLNTTHTASFQLGRTYDSTIPTMESVVLIKYHNWVLFKGYVRAVSPSDTPESIVIEAENKNAEDGDHNKYFHVGHKPVNSEDLYYETIAEALTNEFSWTPGIGDFIPEIMTLWGTKEDEAITQLVQSSGNFGWYFDVNENRILWQGGAGRVVNLPRQNLGENLNLFHVLEHRFTENIDNIVNKYIVQMGALSQTQQRTYQTYWYNSMLEFATSGWNPIYEVRAQDSVTGEGWDSSTPAHQDLYKDVFRVYNLPFINKKLEKYTDEYPPAVEIILPYGALCNVPAGVQTDGFTLDYQNGKLIFNQPVYAYYLDGDGELIKAQAPTIHLLLWKKQFWTFTTTFTENPEVATSNPMRFITNQVGTYPNTIFEVLNLSNLSIRGSFINNKYFLKLPGWDDTEFAKDYAYWQLSKTAEPEITGTVKVTLDNVCFNNIDLATRINSTGITAAPMNIMEMSYDLSDFSVTLSLQNISYYKRTVDLPTHIIYVVNVENV